MENGVNGAAAVSYNGVSCNGNGNGNGNGIGIGIACNGNGKSVACNGNSNGVACNGNDNGVACNGNGNGVAYYGKGNGAASAATEEDDLILLRRLQITDKSKGFIELLAQLSPTVTPLSDDDFRKRFEELVALGDRHLIIVAEDRETGRILATGSVYAERKFTRGGGLVGHIEDVVVDAAARGRHLGQRVVRRLTGHSKAMGCYKVILNCTPERQAFYEKCGFTEKNIQMCLTSFNYDG